MSKLLAVKGDPVDGKDTHAVSGTAKSNPTSPYSGTGDYTYKGEVKTGLSDLVTIAGTPLAVVSSGSDLRSDGQTDHQPQSGSNFKPQSPPPNTELPIAFVPPTGVGPGKPSAGAGSALLTVDGVKALLHGDAFDTCGIKGGVKSSTVTASGQAFVTCSA
jgi:hypothetical protein